MAPMSNEAILQFLREQIPPEQVSELKKTGSIDFAFEALGGLRIRAHAYINRGMISLAIRVITSMRLDFESLYLPAVVSKMTQAQRGIILVTGATGSGKSTTVAAMLESINASRSAHVVTIEDPIEYVFEDNRSIFSQREIGQDVGSFALALRAALRQDPDVILVGEIRDMETAQTALHAAETGHLIISTLHTTDAVETVQRITAMFPGSERDMARRIFSNALVGLVSQRLVARCDTTGRVPAVEILVGNESVREVLRDPNRLLEVRDLIEEGGTTYGMQSFDQSLMSHFEAGRISYDEAMKQSTNPADFALQVSGIRGT